MTIIDILLDALFAALAGCGFGLISNPPLRTLGRIAILAAVGHALRYCLMNLCGVDIATASFLAAFLIGLCSFPLAKSARCPMTVLYIPALLPMIPGIYAYKTVFALIMFLRSASHQGSAEGMEYMQQFFYNGSIAVSVVALLTIGATLPNFIFKKRAFSLTRREKP